MAGSPDDLVVVGTILGAHGVRGDVRVRSYTGEPGEACRLGPLLAASGAVLLTPVRARAANDHLIVTPEERRQKEDWDALKGTELHVPRGALPEPEDDEVYIEDLVGLDAVDTSGKRIGRVVAVQNFGASDLIEIDAEDRDRTVYIPLTGEDVTDIDLESGRVVIASWALWTDEGEASGEEG